MRIVSRISPNLLNSQAVATMPELEKLFAVAPNTAAKTIRLFPQNSISLFTEGLGEIYDIKASTNVMGINDRAYKWKLRGHQIPKVLCVARVTGGAIGTGDNLGANETEFIIALQSSYYNPRDIIKLEDSSMLYVMSEPRFIKEGTFEYTVRLNTNNSVESVSGQYLQPNKTTGIAGNAYPEISDKGYINAAMAAEEHIGYITKTRHDYQWSADAAATKYLIQDTVQHNGKEVKVNSITSLMFLNAMEQMAFKKEMEYIYGRTTMDARGRCFLQDEKGQNIIKGDGVINQMADGCKQTYTDINIDLFEDILTDMSLKMAKRTGNTILVTSGAQGYKAVQRVLRAEHKGYWSMAADKYVKTVNGKIQLGAEYNAYEFNGNKIIFNCNEVFDHPANVSAQDSEGRFLESSKFLFLDTSSYDGVKNIQVIAKDGRSFITGDLDGVGGQDGKTSGKVSSSADASMKIMIGTCGVVMHNPYSSYMLEKKII
jgi:hypothetical protein